MKKTYTKWLSGVLVFLMILSLATPALAAEAPKVSVPVRVRTTGHVPAGMKYEIVLKADNPAYPMPDGSENGTFVFTTTEAGLHLLPEITFTNVGVYTYKISQNPGTNPRCTYDNRVYELVVYVTYTDDGELQATVLLYLVGSEQKLEEATFTNRCRVPGTEPPVTEPPVTEPPATEPPATEPPATEPPATEPPATEPPATEPPATEPPTTQPPTTDPVKTEKPKTEKPKTEKPKPYNPITGDAGVMVPLLLSGAALVGLAVLEGKRKRK